MYIYNYTYILYLSEAAITRRVIFLASVVRFLIIQPSPQSFSGGQMKPTTAYAYHWLNLNRVPELNSLNRSWCMQFKVQASS